MGCAGSKSETVIATPEQVDLTVTTLSEASLKAHEASTSPAKRSESPKSVHFDVGDTASPETTPETQQANREAAEPAEPAAPAVPAEPAAPAVPAVPAEPAAPAAPAEPAASDSPAPPEPPPRKRRPSSDTSPPLSRDSTEEDKPESTKPDAAGGLGEESGISPLKGSCSSGGDLPRASRQSSSVGDLPPSSLLSERMQSFVGRPSGDSPALEDDSPGELQQFTESTSHGLILPQREVSGIGALPGAPPVPEMLHSASGFADVSARTMSIPDDDAKSVASSEGSAWSTYSTTQSAESWAKAQKSPYMAVREKSVMITIVGVLLAAQEQAAPAAAGGAKPAKAKAKAGGKKAKMKKLQIPLQTGKLKKLMVPADCLALVDKIPPMQIGQLLVKAHKGAKDEDDVARLAEKLFLSKEAHKELMALRAANPEQELD